VIQRVLLFVCLVFAVPVLAEDAKAKAAREELERQLNQMVAKQPSRVRIDLAALDEPNYQLEEASFELDGRALGSPSVSQLMREGEHLVWSGDVTPGKHTVKVLLVYANGSSIVVSDEGGYKWRVGGAVSFDVQAGIEVRVVAKPARDATQTDISKRFKISLPAKPVMLAEVDDGKMPEPVKPAVVVAPVVDAGAPAPTAAELAAEEKRKTAEAAAQAKLAAAEAQKQKAADAAEAKRLAAEEQKRKLAEAAEAKKQKAAAALEAKRLAAEEKKRQAAAALEAKRLAAEEKKRQAAEALALSKLSAEERKQKALEAAEAQRLAEEQKAVLRAAADGQKPIAMVTADPVEKPAAVEDAGAPPVAIIPEIVDAGVDAGTTAVVVAAPDAGTPVAAAPAPTTPESEGPPWLIIGIGGGVLALVLLIVLARRSARPPTLDE
jgi:hypothetical protein